MQAGIGSDETVTQRHDVVGADLAVVVHVKHPEGPGGLHPVRAPVGHDAEQIEHVLEGAARVATGGKHLEDAVPERVELNEVITGELDDYIQVSNFLKS